MNLLKAQDTKLKVESLSEFYLVKIDDYAVGTTKQLSVKSSIFNKPQLLKLIEIAGDNNIRCQTCTDNSDLIEILIY